MQTPEEKKVLEVFKEKLEKTLEKSQDDFEKQIIYISGGALGASMLFIEKIIKDIGNAHYKWMLITCWISFGMTLVINLFSHYLSSTSSYKTIAEIDGEIYDNVKAEKRNKIVDNFNKITLGLLMIGILLLILFVALNL